MCYQLVTIGVNFWIKGGAFAIHNPCTMRTQPVHTIWRSGLLTFFGDILLASANRDG